MRGFDERLFFEHDLATPFSNLQGAHYLLKAALDAPPAEAEEALGILAKNIRILERMLHHYWELRRLEASCPAEAPWSASLLATDLGLLVREHGLALPALATAGDLGRLRLAAPRQPLAAGLLGAALTLRAASGEAVRWELRADAGVLGATLTVPGHDGTLDPERLFRKLCWPPADGLFTDTPVDQGLPLLEAVLSRHGGGLELAFAKGEWRLEVWLPGAPS